MTETIIKNNINEQKYMSDEIDQIVAAIAKATLEMPEPKKSKQGNRGHYSTLDDYLVCSKKILAQQGVIIYQHPRYIVPIGRVMFSLLLHTSGQWLLASDIANPDPKTLEKAQSFQQAISSIFTYTKRRLLQSQLGLGADAED